MVLTAGDDTLRLPLPAPAARPRLPMRSLPYAASGGVRVHATAPEDTGAVLVLLTESPWNPGPAVHITHLPAGPPSGEPVDAGLDIGADVDSCVSVTAFFLAGLGREAVHPVIAHIRQGDRSIRLAVDPRRHTLRLLPVLRLRTDTVVPGLEASAGRLVARLDSTAGGRLVAIGRDSVGRLLGLGTAGAGEGFRLFGTRRVIDWTLYLLNDQPRHHSRCRGTRPPRPPPPPPEDWTGRYIASNIDSVLAPYGLPPLRGARLRRGERELRISAGGGMMYQPEYVLRLVVRRDRVRGELYEWWRRWSRKPYAGGPMHREKRPPEVDGCLEPRITGERWVCRIDRMVPVAWRRVLARIDSLGPDRLPAQERGRNQRVSDRGHVLIEASRRGSYSGVYYYGPGASRSSTEARVEGIARVFSDVVAGHMQAAPDSVLKLRTVAAGDLSFPRGGMLVVRNARTWRDLWRRFPSRARGDGRGDAPDIDFSREALLLVGTGEVKDCAWPADFVRRVEVRGDTAYAVVDDQGRHKPWPPPCDPDPAPVQAVAFRVPPEMPVVFVSTTGRYWSPGWLPEASLP